jgi:hypothetical protein
MEEGLKRGREGVPGEDRDDDSQKAFGEREERGPRC